MAHTVCVFWPDQGGWLNPTKVDNFMNVRIQCHTWLECPSFALGDQWLLVNKIRFCVQMRAREGGQNYSKLREFGLEYSDSA